MSLESSPTTMLQMLTTLLDYRQNIETAAQVEMALWSKWTVAVSTAGLLVSVVALLGAFFSLRETQKATRLTREVGEFQTQAYVYAADAHLSQSHGVRVDIKNSGLTPATHFMVNATVQKVKMKEVSRKIEFSPDTFSVWTTLAAGTQLSVDLLDASDVIRNFILGFNRDEDDVLLVCGQILYVTAFNHDCLTQFCFVMKQDTLPQFLRPAGNMVTFQRLGKAGLEQKYLKPPQEQN